ncbi:MAG TPA: patatin-like phospholipase family protein [Acidimicrobiales bacterium]
MTDEHRNRLFGRHGRSTGNAEASPAVAAEAPAAAPTRPLRVLAVDGGGIRGIIPAMVLAEIERRTGKPGSELFDLIAGTSTGGIIALGLVLPGPDGRPVFTAEDGIRIYEEKGGVIFTAAHHKRMQTLGSLLHEKYPVTGLEEVLAEEFGSAMLSDALTPVLVTSYELGRRETFIFSSRAAKADAMADFPMRVAARATSAAPTFFEPALVEDAGGHRHVFIDGAVFANNPAMCAFAEVEATHPGSDLTMVSIGAGALTQGFDWDVVKTWGAAQWARPILNIVLDGASQVTDAQLAELLGPDRYFRFQLSLDKGDQELDNARPENIRHLKQQASAMIARNSARLDAVCELLV